jgi:hypothetical protein
MLFFSPGPTKARAAMEDAAFTRDRLRIVLPRLQARLKRVVASEYAARWGPDFKQVGAEHAKRALPLRALPATHRASCSTGRAGYVRSCARHRWQRGGARFHDVPPDRMTRIVARSMSSAGSIYYLALRDFGALD